MCVRARVREHGRVHSSPPPPPPYHEIMRAYRHLTQDPRTTSSAAKRGSKICRRRRRSSLSPERGEDDRRKRIQFDLAHVERDPNSISLFRLQRRKGGRETSHIFQLHHKGSQFLRNALPAPFTFHLGENFSALSFPPARKASNTPNQSLSPPPSWPELSLSLSSLSTGSPISPPRKGRIRARDRIQ